MGSIILCHKKKARHPYEISRIHRQIYTIEELCYYLCNYLYLVDYTIMNDKLCDWLEQELELTDMAEELRQNLRQSGSPEQFIMAILANASIYTMAELNVIQEVLDKLKNQKPIEKQKFKADSLLNSGGIRQAISIYHSILQDDEDESVDKKFYGKIYASLGAAYGRMFLYEEAAKMYESAYKIVEDRSMLKAYLYACYKYMSPEEYQSMLRFNSLYQQIHFEILELEQEINQKVKEHPSIEMLQEWKDEYRKNG